MPKRTKQKDVKSAIADLWSAIDTILELIHRPQSAPRLLPYTDDIMSVRAQLHFVLGELGRLSFELAQVEEIEPRAKAN
jgi:hypothetical protein